MTAPTLRVLEYALDLGPEDLELIAKLQRELDDGTDLQWVVDETVAQRIQIWRCGPSALILTQIATNPRRRELVVYGIVGRGILPVIDEACADLHTIRATFQCESIGGNVLRPGLRKLYERLGAVPVYTYYRMEQP